MHRATFSFCATGCFSKQLSHAFIGSNSTGECHSMITVSGYDWIIGLKRGDCSGRDRFLSDVEMAKTANLLLSIKLACPFFKPANAEHELVPVQICFSRKLLTISWFLLGSKFSNISTVLIFFY